MIVHTTEACICPGKKCSKCKDVLCHGKFSKDAKIKDGLYSYCKACIKAYQEERKEEIQAKKKDYRQANLDKIKARSDAYCQANRELILARKKLFREKNKEQVREEHRVYNLAHKEQKQLYNAMYTRANPEVFRRKHHVRRTLKTQAGGSYTIAEWEILKARCDYRCLCCGKQEPDIKLTADHVIPVSKQGTSNINNIQPLCKSCNSRKRANIIDYRTPFLEQAK